MSLQPKKTLKKKLNSRGDTIVEVLIAIAIAAFAIGISYATAQRSLQQAITAREHNEALDILENQATDLKVRFQHSTQVAYDTNFAQKNNFCLDDSAVASTDPHWAVYSNYSSLNTTSSPLSSSTTPSSSSPYYYDSSSQLGCQKQRQGEGAVYYYNISTSNHGTAPNSTLYAITVRWAKIGGGTNRATIFYKLNNDPSATLGAVTSTPSPPTSFDCTPQLPNLVRNPDFSWSFNPGSGVAAGFTNPVTAGYSTKLPFRGFNPFEVDDYGVYGTNTGWSGGYGLMKGLFYPFVGGPQQYPFPGDTDQTHWPYDPATGKQVPVGPVDTWWYSNPVQSVDQPIGWSGYSKTFPQPGTYTGVIWEENNISVKPDTKYIFSVYFDNLYGLAVKDQYSPLISMYINGNSIFQQVVVTNQKIPKDPSHPWQYFTYVYSTGPSETKADIQVVDNRGQLWADDYAMTHMGFYECHNS